MATYRRPPVKVLKFSAALLSAAAVGAEGYQRWGGYGATFGILFGLCLGWLAGWWVSRELFD